LNALFPLQRLDLDDPHSLAIHGFVTAYQGISARTKGRMDPGLRRIALDRVIRQFPLLTALEASLLEAGLPGEPSVD